MHVRHAVAGIGRDKNLEAGKGVGRGARRDAIGRGSGSEVWDRWASPGTSQQSRIELGFGRDDTPQHAHAPVCLQWNCFSSLSMCPMSTKALPSAMAGRALYNGDRT